MYKSLHMLDKLDLEDLVEFLVSFANQYLLNIHIYRYKSVKPIFDNS